MNSEKNQSAAHNEVAPVPGQGQQADVRLRDEVLVKMADGIENFAEVSRDAATATDFERKMTLWEAIKLYPKPAMFSLILSLSLVMEGYQTAALGNFFGFPAFQKKFGVPTGKDNQYQLTSTWQSSLQAAVQVGEIIGLWIAGIAAERWGYKKVLLAAHVLIICFIFVMFFAQNLPMLLVGEILCGLPWGAFQTLTTTYAAEISPMQLRPFLTTFCNMCWVMGQMLSGGVLLALLRREDEWGWRIAYATQWAWPILIIPGIMLAPESPWWYVRKDRIEDAKKSLRSMINIKNTNFDVDRNIAMMIHTNEQEKASGSGAHFWDMFRGTHLRRTECTVMVWVIQITCGTWFGGNVLYFLEQAGFDPEQAFNFNLGHSAVGLVGTICAWWALQRIGRRALYLWGLVMMFLLLILIGLLGIPAPSYGIAIGSGVLQFVFTFVYCITVGPVCYLLVTELPSTRLRIKTVALSRNVYNILSIAANYLNNPILNPTAWNLRGKGGFVWAPFTLLSVIWTFYRLPETMGRSAGEMDILFETGTSARKWHGVKVDEFRTDDLKTQE